MKSYGSPTVRRRIIAAELRRLRHELGASQQQVATDVGLTRNGLSRYENAESSMQLVVANQLFGYYGVSGENLDSIIELVEGSRKRGWLKEFRDVVPSWFSEYVCLEQDASQVREFSLAAIPGYLQTGDYARSVLSWASPQYDVEENVKVRLARGDFLRGKDSGNYHIILRETALRTTVGTKSVMANQLAWLAQQSSRPNVRLQVLTENQGAHPSMTSSFISLRFSEFPHFGLVYIDYLTGSLYRDEATEVARYEEVFSQLAKLALPPAKSRSLIQSIAKGHKT